MRQAFAVLLLAAALAGCTSAVAPGEADAPERVANTAYLSPSNGDSAIVVTRDTGYVGSMCTLHVSVDAHEIAGLDPGQGATIYVPPGTHYVDITTADLCGGVAFSYPVTTKAHLRELVRLSASPIQDSEQIRVVGEAPL